MNKTARIDQYLKSKKVTADTKITLALLIELLDGFKISQFQSSPKWVDELYLLQKSITAADPFGYDVLIKDLKKQIDSIISKVETPGNVSPQAAVVAEEKFFTTDEVWRMYSEDPAYGHKSYKEFAEENGWVMVRLKAAPTPTEEQDKEVKEVSIREAYYKETSHTPSDNPSKYYRWLENKFTSTQPLPVGELNKMAKLVIWTDGSYKLVSDGVTHEFENDATWLTTISIKDLK